MTQAKTKQQWHQVLIIVTTLVASRGSVCLVRHSATIARMPAAKPRPNLVRKRSRVHGFGVFTAEPISKNTRVIDYAGELVRNSRSEAREDRYLADGCIWVFRVNRTWSRDAAVGGNIARFINHSCTPNCWFEVVDKTIWIRAARQIRRGEELTYDYGLVYEGRLSNRARKAFACRCGARRCRGTMLAKRVTDGS